MPKQFLLTLVPHSLQKILLDATCINKLSFGDLLENKE